MRDIANTVSPASSPLFVENPPADFTGHGRNAPVHGAPPGQVDIAARQYTHTVRGGFGRAAAVS